MRSALGRLITFTTVICVSAFVTSCVSHPPPHTQDLLTANETAAHAPAGCDGITVRVVFGELDGDDLAQCVPTRTAMVAIDVFAYVGVNLTESEAFPEAICRVSGYPTPEEELRYNGLTRVENCVTMSPAWAYWGLLHESGSGWQFAHEGVSALQVQPGESVAWVWQFGDTGTARVPIS